MIGSGSRNRPLQLYKARRRGVVTIRTAPEINTLPWFWLWFSSVGGERASGGGEYGFGKEFEEEDAESGEAGADHGGRELEDCPDYGIDVVPLVCC